MKLYPSTYSGSSNRDTVNLVRKDATYARERASTGRLELLLFWSLYLYLTALYSSVCMALSPHARYRLLVHVVASHSFCFRSLKNEGTLT
jgi:hypothetical protein